MALVNQPNQAAAPAKAEDKDSAEFKAAKKAAAERHREKVKAEKEKEHKFFLGLRDHLKANGGWEKLTKDEQDYALARCTPPSERVGHSGPSFFSTVFGENAAVGKSVTLKDVISKTYKGMDTMAASVKKWAAKGIVVEIAVNKQDMLATTYTIKQLSA